LRWLLREPGFKVTLRYGINASVGPQRHSVQRAIDDGERVEFVSRRGTRLVGEVFHAQRDPQPWLVLCHGMESTRGGTKQQAIVEHFVSRGLSVLRFDFSYVGDSEGRFEDLTVRGEVDDLIGALEFVSRYHPSKCVLVGSSLGGTVALLGAAERPDDVDAVATIAAVADAALFTNGLSDGDREHWRTSGVRRWRDGVMRSSFLDDVEALDIADAVGTLRCPLLVMHGDADSVVPVEHARRIAALAAGRVQLEIFAGIDHRFEEPGALASLLDTLERWLAARVGIALDG